MNQRIPLLILLVVSQVINAEQNLVQVVAQDLGSQDPGSFKKRPIIKAIDKTFNLVNEKNSIELNETAPLTGSIALIGQDFTYGMNMVFNKANVSRQLPDGTLIRLTTLNDEFKQPLAERNIRASIMRSPIFIGNFGTDIHLALRPMIKDKKIVLLFPTTGHPDLYSSELEYTMNYRPSIERELEALIKYAVTKEHKRKIAIFYEENRWGEGCVVAAEKLLQKYGLELTAKVSYQQNTVNVMPAVKEIVKRRPQVIICASCYRPTYNFVQLVLNSGFQHCLFLGLGETAPMQHLINKSRGLKMVSSSVTPDPEHSNLPLVKQYRADMQKYLPYRAISQFSLEGYIAGSLMVRMLKKLEPPLTLGKLLQGFESIKNAHFGGMPLNFDPQTRSLSSNIWINKGNGEEWKRLT